MTSSQVTMVHSNTGKKARQPYIRIYVRLEDCLAFSINYIFKFGVQKICQPIQLLFLSPTQLVALPPV